MIKTVLEIVLVELFMTHVVFVQKVILIILRTVIKIVMEIVLALRKLMIVEYAQKVIRDW